MQVESHHREESYGISPEVVPDGKKNIWCIFTRFQNRQSSGQKSYRAKGEWNAYMLTGPGSRRFLNAWTADAKKFADTSESKGAPLHFSSLLRKCFQAYVSQLHILLREYPDGSATRASLLAHADRVTSVDDFQFLTCEFAKVLAMI